MAGYGVDYRNYRKAHINMVSALSADEEKVLVELLGKLKPGFLPYEVFIQVARLVVLSIIEFVPFRLNAENEVEVLLLEREMDDAIWPGELHTPGTVVRPTDTEGKIYLAFERILKDELLGTQVSEPHYVGSSLNKSKRGMEQAQIFWVEVLGHPKIGKFYGVDNLPTEFMESQRKFVMQAQVSFMVAKKTGSKS